MGKTQTI